MLVDLDSGEISQNKCVGSPALVNHPHQRSPSQRILAKQKNVVAQQKLRFDVKKPPSGELKSIMIVIDDFAARKDVLHSDNNVVHSYFSMEDIAT